MKRTIFSTGLVTMTNRALAATGLPDFFKNDFSEVALKRGEPPPNAARYAPLVMGVNFVGGITFWLKIIIDFAISRHAHFVVKKRGS